MIKNKILQDKSIIYYIATYYYLLTLQFFTLGFKFTNITRYRIKEIKKINKDFKPFYTLESLNVFEKNVNEKNKELKSKFKKVALKFVEKNIDETINPVEIKSSHVLFLITVFSTLFFLSGILSTNLKYYFLDFDSSLFFSISDYISSSFNNLVSLSITLFISLIFLVIE